MRRIRNNVRTPRERRATVTTGTGNGETFEQAGLTCMSDALRCDRGERRLH